MSGSAMRRAESEGPVTSSPVRSARTQTKRSVRSDKTKPRGSSSKQSAQREAGTYRGSQPIRPCPAHRRRTTVSSRWSSHSLLPPPSERAPSSRLLPGSLCAAHTQPHPRPKPPPATPSLRTSSGCPPRGGTQAPSALCAVLGGGAKGGSPRCSTCSEWMLWDVAKKSGQSLSQMSEK